MLVTFKKTNTNIQGMVSLPKHILKMWGIDPSTPQEDRTIEIYTEGEKVILKKVGFESEQTR